MSRFEFGICLCFGYFLCFCACMTLRNQNGTLEDFQDRKLEEMGKQILSLQNRLDTLNSSIRKDVDPVMFSATIYSSSSITLQKTSIVVFGNEQINTGGNYNKYDGVFTAPVDGTYLFSWTISNTSGKYVMTELVVNEHTISSTGTTSTQPGNKSHSMTALCKMKTGEHAFIRTTGYGTENTIYSNGNYPRSSFMGMLVHID